MTTNPRPDDDEGPDLFSTIPVARNNDPDTSHEAAGRLGRRRTTSARLILLVVSVAPQTVDEIEDVLDGEPGYRPYKAGSWKRVSDLRSAGLVEDSGERRRGRSGRQQIVWRITPDGRLELRRDPVRVS